VVTEGGGFIHDSSIRQMQGPLQAPLYIYVPRVMPETAEPLSGIQLMDSG